ncbi:MAG: glycosyltransferase family 9 protein, partial [bacterium]|nr:glycosyltransferase family 9 protein [bacterium]
FAVFTAALPHFREIFPNAELTLVGNPLWAELSQWLNEHHCVSKGDELFDRFLALDPASLVDRHAFRDAAQTLGDFDLVVSPAFARTNTADKLVAASGCPSVAPEGDTTNMTARQKRRNDRLYTRLIPSGPAENEVERGLHFVEALGDLPNVPRKAPHWSIPPETLSDTLRGLRARTGFDSEARAYLAVSPFAGASLRQWPLAKCAELLSRISQACPALGVVILGAPGNQADAAGLVDSAGPLPHVVNLAGHASLIETTAVLARARLSISGDTAGNHIASAVGTNYVTILGGGHFGRFFPYDVPGSAEHGAYVNHKMSCYGCNWLCPYRLWGRRPAPCVERITVDAVFETVSRTLSSQDPPE